jgi:hypothetical protein
MRLRKRQGPEPLRVESFGVQLELTLEPRDLEIELAEILPPGWRPGHPSAGAGHFRLRQTDTDEYTVVLGENTCLEGGTRDVALGMLDAQMRLFVATQAHEWVFVHAGVVAQAGRALLLPGESFSGKTTLVAALVLAGAVYYSDEYAVLDGDGRVHPYPRPLSIRSDDRSVTRELRAHDLGADIGHDSAEVAVVVTTRYRHGAEWAPRRLTAGQGIVSLLANTVPARDRPEEVLQTLRRASTAAIMLEGDRGEARVVVPELLRELASVESPSAARL